MRPFPTRVARSVVCVLSKQTPMGATALRKLVKINPATENSLKFRWCRPPVMSNRHFEKHLMTFLTPKLETGINGITDPLRPHPSTIFWIGHWAASHA